MKTLDRMISSLWPATSNPTRRMAFPLLFLGAGLILLQPCAGAPFAFEQTGSLITARSHHTATLLPSGKVLVAGGLDSSSNSLASAELYDPASGTWTETGDLAFARSQHTATLLPNGKVLVAAGKVDHGSEPEMETQPDCHPVCRVGTRKAELYDPETGTWARTGNLKIARSQPTATLLLDGKVLVAGGFMGGGFCYSYQLRGTLRLRDRCLDANPHPQQSPRSAHGDAPA